MGVYYKFFKWLMLERKVLLQIYLLVGLEGLMYLGITLGLQTIITYTTAGQFSASLILLCTLTVISVFFVGLFQLWQMRINETVYQKIFANISSKISNYLITLTDNQKQAIMPKIAQFFEVVNLQKSMKKILIDFSFAVISIVLGLLILPAYNSWFLLFSIVVVSMVYGIITYHGKNAIDSSYKTSKYKYYLFNWFQKNDSYSSVDYNNQSNIYLGSYIESRTKHYYNLEFQYKGILFFKTVFVATLLFVGVYLVHIGELNIGQFVASEIIIFLVVNSVEKIIHSLDTAYDVITAITKIEEIIPNFYVVENEKVKLTAVNKVYTHQYSKKIKRLGYGFLIVGFVTLIAPWTQTIDTNGKVTTLNPENRPQTINSIISGRIEKWYVREGQHVIKNDTIAFISEIKEDYLDPLLVKRTENQIKNKESSIESYEQKINAINTQVDAINLSLKLKTQQARNKLIQMRAKISSDSAEMMANASNFKVAEDQFKRFEELFTKGIISKTDLENRKVKVQETQSKKIAAENKWISVKNEYVNAEIELNSILQEYNEKIMKVESDKFSALSMMYDAEANLTKLQNQVSNYSIRNGYYFILAPQDGYITKTFTQGIGEIIKDGSPLCSIVPSQAENAVELYIKPMDLPLVAVGQHLQLTFDGWPAFTFSGWPGASFGTYSAKIIAVDKSISDNGKFRILAIKQNEKWPDAIQIGSGVTGFALLNNVPVVYELWRKANGFPPEFYEASKEPAKIKK